MEKSELEHFNLAQMTQNAMTSVSLASEFPCPV